MNGGQFMLKFVYTIRSLVVIVLESDGFRDDVECLDRARIDCRLVKLAFRRLKNLCKN